VNREDWLRRAVAPLTDLINATKLAEVPPVWISVGWPKGGGRGRGRLLGQCWRGTTSADGNPHVFVSPEVGPASEVLRIVTHELVHAAIGGESLHRGRFPVVASAVGLIAPWASSPAGPELGARLALLADELGPYPHAVLTEAPRLSASRAGSRLRAWRCPCGVRARVASDTFAATCGRCGQAFERKGT